MRGGPVLASALVLVATACSKSAPRTSTVTLETEHEEEGLLARPPEASAATLEGPFFVAEPDGRPSAILRADAPNIRYARLDRAACEAELGRRAIPFAQATETAGVLAPVWLRGPLHGVSIHSSLPPAQRERSTLEIFDCRLVLALDDFAALAARQDVVEMIHLSAFRARSANGCTPKYVGKQHCAALAVDVGTFRRKDGSVINVEKDFHGRIGLATCAGAARPNPPAPEASTLWDLVCESARQAIFHVILSPNYNVQHKNHLHFEITPDAGWMLIK